MQSALWQTLHCVKGLENTLGAMQQLLFCVTCQIMTAIWSPDQEGSCSSAMSVCETGAPWQENVKHEPLGEFHALGLGRCEHLCC